MTSSPAERLPSMMYGGICSRPRNLRDRKTATVVIADYNEMAHRWRSRPLTTWPKTVDATSARDPPRMAVQSLLIAATSREDNAQPVRQSNAGTQKILE